ncbi:MAG: hypothetical protein QM796_18085 [Chthoniobacteraceae bacterium]
MENPRDVVDFAFLQNPDLSIQRNGYRVFLQSPARRGDGRAATSKVRVFAYQITGGSNLDLPDLAISSDGRWRLEKDIYPNYDIVLCISTFSATAPAPRPLRRASVSAEPRCMA